MIQLKPDKEAFERVCKRLELNPFAEPLNFKDIVDVFGWPAVELYLLCTQENHKIIDLLKEIKRRLR